MRSLKRIVVVVMMMGMLLSAACTNSMESAVAESGEKEGVSVCAELSQEPEDGRI